jgi:hypothetical protein
VGLRWRSVGCSTAAHNGGRPGSAPGPATMVVLRSRAQRAWCYCRQCTSDVTTRLLHLLRTVTRNTSVVWF